MADYIDGTTYKIALAEDQLITLFEDRPEGLIATLVFGDPNQEQDTDAVIAAQREVVEQVVAAANLAPRLQAALIEIVDNYGDSDRATHEAIANARALINKIRGA